jgi:predicted DNA-binding protein
VLYSALAQWYHSQVMKGKEAMQTTIRVRPEIWQALRMLAERRALRQGGRPSASAIVTELVEREAARKLKDAPRG